VNLMAGKNQTSYKAQRSLHDSMSNRSAEIAFTPMAEVDIERHAQRGRWRGRLLTRHEERKRPYYMPTLALELGSG
jgi:hypothetical protein